MFVVASRSLPDRTPTPLQRALGDLRARFVTAGGRTRLAELGESGAAKLRLARSHDASAAPILINTAGGLTGGDRFAVTLDAGPGTRVAATTQASEKIYRSLGDDALVETRIVVGDGARFDWLPQETIMFDRARLRRSFSVVLDRNARFLAVEAVVLGRLAMGETLARGAFRDRWRIRKNGKLVFADDLRFDGEVGRAAAQPASLCGGSAFATVIFVADDCEERLEPVRRILGEASGASAFDGKLVARLTAPDGFSLRRSLVPIVAALGDGTPAPRTWLQ